MNTSAVDKCLSNLKEGDTIYTKGPKKIFIFDYWEKHTKHSCYDKVHWKNSISVYFSFWKTMYPAVRIVKENK